MVFSGADGQPDLEATSLTALALLGAGNTLRSGPYKATLQKAVDWLIARQRSDGSFPEQDDFRLTVGVGYEF